MIEEGDEIRDRPLEVDVVLPKGVIGVNKKRLGGEPHASMIRQVMALGSGRNSGVQSAHPKVIKFCREFSPWRACIYDQERERRSFESQTL